MAGCYNRVWHLDGSSDMAVWDDNIAVMIVTPNAALEVRDFNWRGIQGRHLFEIDWLRRDWRDSEVEGVGGQFLLFPLSFHNLFSRLIFLTSCPVMLEHGKGWTKALVEVLMPMA